MKVFTFTMSRDGEDTSKVTFVLNNITHIIHKTPSDLYPNGITKVYTANEEVTFEGKSNVKLYEDLVKALKEGN